MLENKISDNPVLEKHEIEEILEHHSVTQIDLAITNLLETDDMDMYQRATRFFRDIITYNIISGSGQAIHNNYSDLNFFNIIECNLLSQIAFKREDSVYTLGKVCSVSSITKLEASISKFKDIDPEYVKKALYELEWLKEQDEYV